MADPTTWDDLPSWHPAIRLPREAALRAAAAFDEGNAHTTAGPTPCKVCGGPVAAEEAVAFGHWRRHPDCLQDHPPSLLHGVVAARLPRLAAGLNDEDGGLLERHLPPIYSGHAWLVAAVYADSDNPWPRKPWEHVTKAQLDHLREGVASLPSLRVKAGVLEVPCEQGPCAWCGRQLSRRWTLCGHSWSDGSGAPLCRECSEVFGRYGGGDFYEHAASEATAVAAALTGVPPYLGERPPEGLRPYRETVGDPGQGGQPWHHLDPEAVDAYRLDQWGRHPDHAPPERRAEAVEHWQRVLAAVEARRAAAEAKVKRAAQRYHFDPE